MSDNEKSTFDWKTFLASAVVAVILSIPSWLPVFGIKFEWFGYWLVVAIQRSLPLIGALGGFAIGWNARKRAEKKTITDIKKQLAAKDAEMDDALAEKDAGIEKQPMPEELERQRRAEVLAKVGSTSDDLSPAAFSILEKMTEAEAECMVSLANIAELAPGTSDPDKPLVASPVSDYCKGLGITDELVARLENAGIVSYEDDHVVYETRERENPERISKRYGTRTATGFGGFARLAPDKKTDSPYIVCIPKPGLSFTPFGKEIAKIARVVVHNEAVDEFRLTALSRTDEWMEAWRKARSQK